MASDTSGIHQTGVPSLAETKNRMPRITGTPMPSASCTLVRAAGKAAKARKIAKARWMERASVSLKTPKPIMKGIGEAIQIWNSDHASATIAMKAPTGPC